MSVEGPPSGLKNRRAHGPRVGNAEYAHEAPLPVVPVDGPRSRPRSPELRGSISKHRRVGVPCPLCGRCDRRIDRLRLPGGHARGRRRGHRDRTRATRRDVLPAALEQEIETEGPVRLTLAIEPREGEDAPPAHCALGPGAEFGRRGSVQWRRRIHRLRSDDASRGRRAACRGVITAARMPVVAAIGRIRPSRGAASRGRRIAHARRDDDRPRFGPIWAATMNNMRGGHAMSTPSALRGP